MHFALVHGAYHGAWCWDQLRQELERDGHTTSAVDLPCEDPEAGAERYADEVIHSMPKTWSRWRAATRPFSHDPATWPRCSTAWWNDRRAKAGFDV